MPGLLGPVAELGKPDYLIALVPIIRDGLHEERLRHTKRNQVSRVPQGLAKERLGTLGVVVIAHSSPF